MKSRRWPMLAVALLAMLGCIYALWSDAVEPVFSDAAGIDGERDSERSNPRGSAVSEPRGAAEAERRDVETARDAVAQRVSGRILCAGEPLAAARLTLWRYGTLAGAGVTDSDGAFAIEPSQWGTWELRVRSWSATHLEHRLQITAWPDGADVGDVCLPDGFSVCGRVVDGSGRPLLGARIEAAGSALPSLWTFRSDRVLAAEDVPASVTTRADGRFEVPRVALGCELGLRIRHPEMKRLTVHREMQWAPIDLGDLVLERSPSRAAGRPHAPISPSQDAAERPDQSKERDPSLVVLRGRVTPAPPTYPSCWVDLQERMEGDEDRKPRGGYSDVSADGCFELLVMPGMYDVALYGELALGRHHKALARLDEFVVEAQDPKEVVLPLTSCGVVTVRVSDANGPVDGAEVDVRRGGRATRERGSPALRCDANGELRLLSAKRGAWSLRARRHGLASWGPSVKLTQRVPKEGGAVTLQLAGGSVRGDVDLSGQDRGIEIDLLRPEHAATDPALAGRSRLLDWGVGARRTPARDGQFRFDDVPAGRWLLRVSTDTAVLHQRWLEVNEDRRSGEINLGFIGLGTAPGLSLSIERTAASEGLPLMVVLRRAAVPPLDTEVFVGSVAVSENADAEALVARFPAALPGHYRIEVFVKETRWRSSHQPPGYYRMRGSPRSYALELRGDGSVVPPGMRVRF